MSGTKVDRRQRLDQKVVELLPQLSRAFAAQLVEDGKVTVGGKVIIKAGYKLLDDEVLVDYDLAGLGRVPEIELPVLYEDETSVVIDKPVGVLSHSKGAFNPEATVATWLAGRLAPDLSGERAGIVHRLDRATSGVMICAKTSNALAWLQKQFSQRKTKKTYYAVVSGHMPHGHAMIDLPLGRNPKKPQTFRVDREGKSALTEYWVRGQNDRYSLLELRPQTGRTHQLRVHLSYIGHPIVGDPLYGNQPADRLYLHAESLELTLPSRVRKTFTAPLPAAFQDMVKE